jgi:hypothetical protein
MGSVVSLLGIGVYVDVHQGQNDGLHESSNIAFYPT